MKLNQSQPNELSRVILLSLSLVCFLWLGFSRFFFPFFFLCFSGKRYLWFKASQTELSIAFTGGFLFVLRAGPAWNSDRFHANRRFRFSIQRSNRAEVAESNSFTPALFQIVFVISHPSIHKNHSSSLIQISKKINYNPKSYQVYNKNPKTYLKYDT